MRKRFPNWKPIVGERALVPGGPASAQYVAELNEYDISAIEAGHRGYTPLRVNITDGDPINVFNDTLTYDEIKRVWRSSYGGWAKTLKAVLRAASQYCGKRVIIS